MRSRLLSVALSGGSDGIAWAAPSGPEALGADSDGIGRAATGAIAAAAGADGIGWAVPGVLDGLGSVGRRALLDATTS
ncbi:MAG TPA: hypothetical protein VF395_16355 [Polyangiaceae bacterium]